MRVIMLLHMRVGSDGLHGRRWCSHRGGNFSLFGFLVFEYFSRQNERRSPPALHAGLHGAYSQGNSQAGPDQSRTIIPYTLEILKLSN